MPATDYIPRSDNDLESWATNFSAVITANPTSYGLTAGQATAEATARTNYSTALAAAVNPATRTPVTVATKDLRRAELISLSRQLGQIARRFPSITPALLATAGLTVPDPIPTPIPPPTSTPILGTFSVASLVTRLEYHDSLLVDPRAKPFGAILLELWQKVGGPAPTSIADCEFVKAGGRSPLTITYAGGQRGLIVYYIARWINARGQPGPESPVYSQVVN